MSQHILGIDIAKDKFDVALRLDQQTLTAQFANTTAGFRLLQEWWLAAGVTQLHACMEATGAYGTALALFLHQHGQTVSVVNPLRIKGYAQAQLKRHKTDQADACLIADFCATQKPAQWTPPSAQVEYLQALTRRIEALQGMLQAEQNRLDVALPAAQPSLARMIATLRAEIHRLEAEIQAYIDDDPDLQEQSRLLQSIPGIGAKTACLLLSEIEFASYDNARQVAAHAGLTPKQEQSGTSVNRTKLSKLGKGRIRKALYFPAVSAKRHNAPLREFAQRLEHNGKTPMQIICAVMRKLLHQAYGILKQRIPFDAQLAFSA
jgi:transposase